MIQFLSICRNTFVQTIRQPIYLILILVTFAVLVFVQPFCGLSMGGRDADQMMYVTVGLSTLLGSGLLISAFSASGVLAREIEDRTALTVISKPVPRATFVLGKFAGVSAAVAAAFYLCALVFLMVVRHRVLSTVNDPMDWPVITLGLLALGLAIVAALLGNLMFGWHVSSAGVTAGLLLFTLAAGILSFVGKEWTIVPLGYDYVPTGAGDAPVITPMMIKGIVLMFVAVLILCAIAIAASTRLGQMMTLLVCIGGFVVGSIQPQLAGMAEREPAFNLLAWLAPNLTYFYTLDALTAGKQIPLALLGGFALYGLLYAGAVLAVGISLFQSRQLESRTSSGAMPGAVGLLAWTGRLACLVLAFKALIALSHLFLPGAQWLAICVEAVVLLGIAAVGWVIWGYFARGRRWTYYITLAGAGLSAAGAVALWAVPNLRQIAAGDVNMVVATGVAALVLIMLVLPKTRRHFKKVS